MFFISCPNVSQIFVIFLNSHENFTLIVMLFYLEIPYSAISGKALLVTIF